MRPRIQLTIESTIAAQKPAQKPATSRPYPKPRTCVSHATNMSKKALTTRAMKPRVKMNSGNAKKRRTRPMVPFTIPKMKATTPFFVFSVRILYRVPTPVLSWTNCLFSVREMCLFLNCLNVSFSMSGLFFRR